MIENTNEGFIFPLKESENTTVIDEMEAGNTENDSQEASNEPSKLEDTSFVTMAKGVIESVLFAAGYPVKYEKLAKVLEITAGEARRIVTDYAEEYNNSELPRGVILLTYDDGCQLCTKEINSSFVREALGIRRGGNLSASSIEVLAIIAYNEPVTRAYIDTVRGVDSSYAVSSLVDKHLIESCGRLDVPGRPLIYRTTDDFLRVFGMQSLGDLPEVSITPDGEKQQELPLVEDIEEAEEIKDTTETEVEE